MIRVLGVKKKFEYYSRYHLGRPGRPGAGPRGLRLHISDRQTPMSSSGWSALLRWPWPTCSVGIAMVTAKDLLLPATSGSIVVCFTHPLELTKSRLQLDNERASRGVARAYSGFVDCFAKSARMEGMRGLQPVCGGAVRCVGGWVPGGGWGLGGPSSQGSGRSHWGTW